MPLGHEQDVAAREGMAAKRLAASERLCETRRPGTKNGPGLHAQIPAKKLVVMPGHPLCGTRKRSLLLRPALEPRSRARNSARGLAASQPRQTLIAAPRSQTPCTLSKQRWTACYEEPVANGNWPSPAPGRHRREIWPRILALSPTPRRASSRPSIRPCRNTGRRNNTNQTDHFRVCPTSPRHAHEHNLLRVEDTGDSRTATWPDEMKRP